MAAPARKAPAKRPAPVTAAPAPVEAPASPVVEVAKPEAVKEPVQHTPAVAEARLNGTVQSGVL